VSYTHAVALCTHPHTHNTKRMSARTHRDVLRTERSPTEENAPRTTGARSPRRTAPYQTLARSCTVTSPTRVALGATQASTCVFGTLPPSGTEQRAVFHPSSSTGLR